MILNVSGRTDVCAFYADWFFKRYNAGFIDVRNPFNYHFVNRIFFKNVDLILFCSKNPHAMIKYLPQIKKPIIFHITITPYLSDIEPNVPNKKGVIEDVKQIASIIGKENVYVRYDPLFISPKYNLAYHKKCFERLCASLEGSVERIIISFIDECKNVNNHLEELKVLPFKDYMFEEIGLSFASSANAHNMKVQTCFEERRLLEYGFSKEECLSKEKAKLLTGKDFSYWKARKEHKCNCVEMVDIGHYNSCKHYCKYCYANFDERQIEENFNKHEDSSTMLIGHLEDDDIIKERI